MMDGLTNILLITLIGLVGYIGKVFYEKMEGLYAKIEQIIKADISSTKDVERLRSDVDDHEQRISKIENK